MRSSKWDSSLTIDFFHTLTDSGLAWRSLFRPFNSHSNPCRNMFNISYRMPRTHEQLFWCGFSISSANNNKSAVREERNMQRDFFRAVEWWHERGAQCGSKWGFFCFVSPFWKELLKSQGLLQTKLAVQKQWITLLRERYLMFFGWTQPAYSLSVEVREQSLFLDLDPLNLFYQLCYLQVCPWDYFFFCQKEKGLTEDERQMKLENNTRVHRNGLSIKHCGY